MYLCRPYVATINITYNDAIIYVYIYMHRVLYICIYIVYFHRCVGYRYASMAYRGIDNKSCCIPCDRLSLQKMPARTTLRSEVRSYSEFIQTLNCQLNIQNVFINIKRHEVKTVKDA